MASGPPASFARLLRMGEQQVEAVGDEVAAGAVAGGQDEHGQPDHLVLGDGALVVMVDQLGEDVVLRAGAACPPSAGGTFPPVPASWPLTCPANSRAGVPLRAHPRGEQAEVARPVVKAPDVVVVDAEGLADQLEG